MKSKTTIKSIFDEEYEVEPIYMDNTDCGLVDCIHCKSQCNYGVRYSNQILWGY